MTRALPNVLISKGLKRNIYYILRLQYNEMWTNFELITKKKKRNAQLNLKTCLDGNT